VQEAQRAAPPASLRSSRENSPDPRAAAYPAPPPLRPAGHAVPGGAPAGSSAAPSAGPGASAQELPQSYAGAGHDRARMPAYGGNGVVRPVQHGNAPDATLGHMQGALQATLQDAHNGERWPVHQGHSNDAVPRFAAFPQPGGSHAAGAHRSAAVTDSDGRDVASKAGLADNGQAADEVTTTPPRERDAHEAGGLAAMPSKPGAANVPVARDSSSRHRRAERSRAAEWEVDAEVLKVLDAADRDEPRINELLQGVYAVFGEAILPWVHLGELSHVMI
jgi:hypothetical protein